MPNTTPRFGLTSPLGTEAPNVDLHLKNIADGVDALAAIYGQGTLAARPVSTPGTPGKTGRFYMVTSGAETGELYYDYGTGWILVNPDQGVGPDSITATEIAANAVGASELADNAVDTAAIAALAVTFAKLENALKPSAGAGAAAEALRALGTGAANAAAGNDARLSDQRVPTDNSVTQAKMADNSVGTAEIIDANVTLPKLAANSVDASKIVDGSVGDAELSLSYLRAGADGFRYQAGMASGLTVAGGTSVAFPTAFGASPVAVVITNHTAQAAYVQSKDANGFVFNWSGMGTGDGYNLEWIAIGAA